MITQYLLIHILLLITVTNATICKLSDRKCIFSGVRTTESKPYFNPSSSDNAAVEEVRFEDSMMPILTSEICRTFPNLQVLEVCELSMKEIAPKALQECKNLTNINFYDNHLEKLDVKVFESNSKLEYINLQGTHLKEIDGRIFDPTTRLEQLILGDNYLSEFRVDQFLTLQKLTVLDLFSNNLLDLDGQKLIQKFPNLEEITINNNLFDCDRLKGIVKNLHENYVDVIEWEKDEHDKCDLSDISMEPENLAIPLSDSQDRLSVSIFVFYLGLIFNAL